MRLQDVKTGKLTVFLTALVLGTLVQAPLAFGQG